MTLRDWVSEKLSEKDPSQLTRPTYPVDPIGTNGILVHRSTGADAYIYVPDPSAEQLFTAADFRRARSEVSNLRFVVLIRRRAANDVYPLADSQGIAIGSLGALQSALEQSSDIGAYRSNEQKYVQSRLDGNAQVLNWRRVGESAYHVARTAGRRSLTVVTDHHYELTSDAVYAILAVHAELTVDAVVVTNPSTRGFASTVVAAAQDAGTRVMTLSEFLASLRQPWN